MTPTEQRAYIAGLEKAAEICEADIGRELWQVAAAIRAHAASQPAAQPVAEDVEMMKKIIARANNSLFGSFGFFMSDQGDKPPHEFHLHDPIERLKADCNRWYRAASPYTTPEALAKALSVPSAEPQEARAVARPKLLESAATMMEYGRCTATDDDAASKFAFFRDQLRLAAASHSAEPQEPVKVPEGWDVADVGDAQAKLRAIADYMEQLENFDDATFLRRLAAAPPKSGDDGK